jgi:hypothetical protein
MKTPFEELCIGAFFTVFVVAGMSLCNMLWNLPSHPEVWTDEGTDCEYIHTMTGITPRLNSLGLQVGCNWHSPDVNFPPSDLPPSPAEIAETAEKEKKGNICVR